MEVRTLIVEDDGNQSGLIRSYLEREGFEVHEARDGASGIDTARQVEPEVIVLDWMLPGMDGLEFLRELRQFSEAYVIMLTARVEETDRIVGLSTGADDYLTKPFSPGELVARIRAMLRRPRSSPGAPETGVLVSGELEVDPDRRRVRVEGREVSLTAIEFDLLFALSSRPGFVFSRRWLLQKVWGEDYFGEDHVIDVHIANLRKKLGPSGARCVETVRGVGYRFVEP